MIMLTRFSALCWMNGGKGNYMAQIPADAWHTVVTDEPCVISEMKDGTYAPTSPEDVID